MVLHRLHTSAKLVIASLFFQELMTTLTAMVYLQGLKPSCYLEKRK